MNHAIEKMPAGKEKSGRNMKNIMTQQCFEYKEEEES